MGERAMSADSVYPADMHRGMADSRSMETMNMVSVSLVCKGRSQLSTFMIAYREYARGRGSGTNVRFFPENQHFMFYH